MKLLLDENLSRKLVPFLQERFPGTTHVVLAGLERATDLEIWRHARDGGFVLVTRDEDFVEIGALRGTPPMLIWLRISNPGKSKTLQALLQNADSFEKASQQNLACVEVL